jgi:cobalamin-dependent methionine synthase I
MTDYTSLEILKGSLSHLPEDELNLIVTAIQEEQNARKNKRKQELVKKAITILTELYNVCDDSITIECDNCGHEIHLDFDVLAQIIEFQIE